MEVILLEKIGKLGTVGDIVDVKSGFGRNFLLPLGKAVSATKANKSDFEARRAELEAAANDKIVSAQGRAKQIEALGELRIGANAGDEGKLFGSIGTRDIAMHITDAGVAVSKSEVKLPEGTLREVGEYEIDLQLHVDVVQTIKIVVEADANA